MRLKQSRLAWAGVAMMSVLASGCGGGGSESPAPPAQSLSANQQAYESFALASNAGMHRLRWNLNYSGSQVVGTNYAYSEYATLAASPLTNGPQVATETPPVNITATLNLSNSGPTRILKDGTVLVVPGTLYSTRVSYEGSDVRTDFLASDNATVAYTEISRDYTVVPMSGLVSGAPLDLAHWLNSFYSNSAVLAPGFSFDAGAAYLKYTDYNQGDRYNVFDCTTATTTAAVTPCVSGTTLSASLTTGIVSNSDARTYHLADGTLRTVGGVPMWISTAIRPTAATLSSVVQYRIYYQLNGNVYTGAFIQNGTRVGGNYYVSSPAGTTVDDRLTYLPFQIRLNRAARDSIARALAI